MSPIRITLRIILNPGINLVQDRSESTEDNPDKPAVTFKPSSPSQSLKDRKESLPACCEEYQERGS